MICKTWTFAPATPCERCKDTGLIRVSYASAENGPTDDPDDEYGLEFCDCEAGWTQFVTDNIEMDMAQAQHFGFEYKGPTLDQVPTLVQQYMDRTDY